MEAVMRFLVVPVLLAILTPAVSTLCSPVSVLAQCVDYGEYLHWVGSADTPEEARDVAILGNYAYVANAGSALQVIDISDPQNPQTVGSVEGTDARGVTISGMYAYVTDGSVGLKVIDIANSYDPQIVGEVELSGQVEGIDVSGTYAYVADGNFGLQVVDITNPQDPQVVGNLGGAGVRDVTISGTYAYVAAGTLLYVFDISNPLAPLEMDAIHASNPWGVAVSGTNVYVAAGAGLRVIDVSDPLNIEVVGVLDTPGSARGVAVDGTYAYIADYDSGLQVIDITNPENPQIVGYVITPGEAQGVAVSGTHAYIADGFLGLGIADISNPDNLPILGTVDTTFPAQDVAISENYAYVGAGGHLRVVDFTVPQDPQVVGSVYVGGVEDIAISDMHAYLATTDGLQVVDITNPLSPQIAGNVDTGHAYGVSVAGIHAYVAGTDFHVVDLTSQEIVGSVDTPGYPVNVAVSGTHAFVTTHDDMGLWSSLQVVDITNSQNPQVIGGVYTGLGVEGVAISGTHAYVVNRSTGLQIVDISNPPSPQIVATMAMRGEARDVVISGYYAYVAVGETGLQVIDVTNPMSPRMVGNVDTPWEALGVAVSGDYAFIANGQSDDLYIFSAQCDLYACVTPALSDVPDDQGGQLTVSWPKHYSDSISAPVPVVEYDVQRLNGDWLSLTIVPAVQAEEYSVGVPTEDILVLGQPAPYSQYRIVALTEAPLHLYTSLPDSGYSIDNLSPQAPELTLYDTETSRFLHWQSDDVSDLNETCLYRGPEPEFETGEPLVCSSQTDFWFVEDDLARYYYRARTFDIHGNASEWSSELIGNYPTDVPGTQITKLRLYPNYPNPFNPSTTIKFAVPRASHVSLGVYDLAGHLVRPLIYKDLASGEYTVVWDGRDLTGRLAPSGSYFYRLTTYGNSVTRRMVLVK